MKAIHYIQYGSPDVLQLVEIEKPVPQDNQVLIKIHAAATNPLDWHLMRGEPFLARLDAGLFKPKSPKLGVDIAGTVEAIGSSVTTFNVGDEVYGSLFQNGMGGFAEYACATEQEVVLKPDNISFEEAAAVPVVAFTALQGLRFGNIESRQKVLVNGASGGVGSFAVQIAKSFGAEVTGVCSTRNLEMVKAMGADYVVDYTREDFTDNGQQYDLIYDAVGNRSLTDLKRALTSDGQCVIAGFTTLPRLFEHMLLGGWATRGSNKTIGMMGTAQVKKDDLLYMNDLLKAGKVKPIIDRCYPLEQTAEAIRYLETMRARGKVIITMV